MPDIELLGARYLDVPAVDLPKSGGGTARFYDVSGALCTITVEKDGNNDVYTSDKTAQEVYDALTVGINPVFRFHDTRNSADAYIYVSLDSLQGTANGYELSLSSFQTDAMTAATLSDFFEYVILPTIEKTVSGSTIVIMDAVASAAVRLLAAIVPTQDLNGYDKPWGPGAGTNKFDNDHSINSTHTSSIATALSTYKSTGQYATGYTTNATTISNNAQYCTTFTPCTSGTTYTIKNLTSGSNLALIGFVDDSGTVVSHNSSWSNQAWTHTANSTEKYIMVCAKVAELQNVMIVQGSTMPSTVSPYSNICPLVGASAANIVVSPTASAGDGTTYTVQFSGTCRGGSLDVTSGVLSKRPYYSVYNGESLNGPWMSSMDAYASGTLPTTGAEVVDLGGAFTTEQLTPTTVQILQGENHIWSDTGDTTLTYMAVDA